MVCKAVRHVNDADAAFVLDVGPAGQRSGFLTPVVPMVVATMNHSCSWAGRSLKSI
jgi:hypothetical protein